MTIEILLCERDSHGRKLPQKVKLTGSMLPEYRAQLFEQTALRGLGGKKRQKAAEKLYSSEEN